MNHKSGTIQTDITGTNKPISLAQFDPIYPLAPEYPPIVDIRFSSTNFDKLRFIVA